MIASSLGRDDVMGCAGHCAGFGPAIVWHKSILVIVRTCVVHCHHHGHTFYHFPQKHTISMFSTAKRVAPTSRKQGISHIRNPLYGNHVHQPIQTWNILEPFYDPWIPPWCGSSTGGSSQISQVESPLFEVLTEHIHNDNTNVWS